MILNSTTIHTPIGAMTAIADEQKLYLLEFLTRRGLNDEMARLQTREVTLVPGTNPVLTLIEKELGDYFQGKLQTFKTPYHVSGTSFQEAVWQQLCHIPYGATLSYAAQAAALGRPKAYRAVANANGANQLAIIVPCHRVIASDGSLGGYGAGLSIKTWLLQHEKQHQQ